MNSVSWSRLLTRNARDAAPWLITWVDCRPGCPPPDVGPGKISDPARIP